MSNVIDTLITKFQHDGHTWESEGPKIGQIAKGIVDHVKAAATAVDDFGKKIKEHFGVILMDRPGPKRGSRSCWPAATAQALGNKVEVRGINPASQIWEFKLRKSELPRSAP